MEPLEPRTILFYDLCRLCLANAGADDMFTKLDLVRDIFLCTGVHVNIEDNLPRKICFQCLEIVVQAKRLRILATANETHMKSLFDDNETFAIGFNKTNQSLKEQNTISRKLSTDSNQTVKLEIIESSTDCPEEESQSRKRKTSDRSEQSKSEEKFKISVRKDLLDTPADVTSPKEYLINTSSKKQNLKVKIKRYKTDSDDCFHYVCDVCQKKFNGWKKYYLHQKTHNRRIMCPIDVCGKMFATKGDLEKHVRTHTGERPFSCDVCDRRFSQRGTLKSHKLTVHGKYGTPEKS